MMIITVSFIGRPDKRSELIKLCRSMIEPSRNEDGCVSYSFYQDITDENAFFFFEEWRDQQAIDKHVGSKHYTDFMPIFASWIVGNSDLKVRSVQ
jgi:quinol monooxygenase YgiN